ncbi:glutaminyl-peptide cyclotransferase [Pedobacter sp. P351]|uniref:glutaminyl-peptide cyclotransferase n=1 Tax=Pedobacter superstes TaxID=3133441 RepID=UPI0030AC0C1D
MHFGKSIVKTFYLFGIITLALTSCKRSPEKPVYFISPIEGGNVTPGETIILKTDAKPGGFDSIAYFIDSKYIAGRADTQGVKYSVEGLSFGLRVITAKIYSGSDFYEVSSNIQLLPSKVPVIHSFKIVNVYPHDTTSYTEGLEFHDGVLYESDGGYADLGGSSLRKTDLKTGKILAKVDIDGKYFAEGITVVGNRIIQLTYREGVGFVYDKETFKKIAEFPYTAGREGWGLAFNGTQILNTDGTNNIYFLNRDTYQKENTLQVYDNKGPVSNLNELELVDGKIYANIYLKSDIAIIDPKTGLVESYINLAGLLPPGDHVEGVTDVLNGIAWDSNGKRLFVTGKKWNKLFEIKIQ